MPIYTGMKVVYGVCEPKPIVGAPDGRQRLRMRSNGVARLFVKTPDGIRTFFLEDRGDTWFVNPRLEKGRTKTL